MTQDVVLGRKAAICVQKAEKLPDQGKLRRIGGSLVDQQHRDVIADGVDTVAGIALKGFGVGFEDERLFAGGTDQEFEEVRGDHDRDIVRRGEGDRRVLVTPVDTRNPTSGGRKCDTLGVSQAGMGSFDSFG
jgi:hypothetical protein